MEYSYTNLPDWFAKFTVRALEDKVTVRYKTLVSDVLTETSYKSMSGKTTRGKQGNAFWLSAALAMLLLWTVLYWVIKFTCPIWMSDQAFDTIFYSALILGGVFISLRFVKEEYVWFYDKSNNIELAIKITNKKREQAEQIIKLLQDKIQEANS